MYMKNILNDAEEVWEIDDFYKEMRRYRGPYVYAWYNKTNKKIYIGSSSRLVGRFSNYYRAINGTAKFHSIILSRVFAKYKKEDFLFLILKKLNDKTKCVEEEQLLIDMYEPFGEKGYNASKNASSCLGIKHSPEVRRAASLRWQGEKSPNARLKDKDIVGIFYDFVSGISRPQLSKKYNISERQLFIILRREQWGHIPIDKEIVEAANGKIYSKLSEEAVEEIAKRLLEGVPPKDIAREFQCSVDNVLMINRGHTYPKIKEKYAPNSKCLHDYKPKNKRYEELDKAIKDGILSGLGNAELANKLGISVGPVLRIKREVGLIRPANYISHEKAMRIGRMLEKGVSKEEISKTENICGGTINCINSGKNHPYVKAKIAPNRRFIKMGKKFVPISKIKKMVSLLKLGRGVGEVREETNLSRSYILKWKNLILRKQCQNLHQSIH